MTDAPAFPPKLAAALCKVSSEVKQLGKSERNEFAKYNFVSVDRFYEAIGSLMAKHGVHCIPDCVESDVVANTKTGKPLLRERWAFTLIHESGECAGPFHRTVTVPAEGAQAHGSSESYAQKQFLRGVFRVPTGDKDDADDGDKPEHGVTAKPAPVETIDTERAALLDNNIKAAGGDLDAILRHFQVTSLRDLTPAQADAVQKKITAAIEKGEAA